MRKEDCLKQDQDLRAIIASHEAELTDMEATLPNIFYHPKHDSTPCPLLVTELLHVSKV